MLGYLVDPSNGRSSEVEGSSAFLEAPLLAVSNIVRNNLAMARWEVANAINPSGLTLSGGLRTEKSSSKEEGP
jgi:hypothetical protein